MQPKFLTPKEYNSAKPFPYAVIDGRFFPHRVAQAEVEFPPWDSSIWSRFGNEREVKGIAADWNVMGDSVSTLLLEMCGPEFTDELEKMTGIPNLVADTYGGGMHVVPSDGKLGVHTDFNQGPKGHRRLNVLLFLNSDWQPEYGGDLELWSPDKKYFKVIAPIANRLVVFNTSETSFHGHPKPMTCPPDRTRKSLAVYFYTTEPPENVAAPHSTVFMETE